MMTSQVFSTLSVAILLLSIGTATQLPNSCQNLEDGEYWMKLMDGDDYPAVQLKCSNGYTILDYNQDPNIANYFTSWVMWHYAIAGPSNGDTVNWSEWYKEGMQSKYIVSPDCNTCDETSGWQKYDTTSTYWMSGNVFGCFWSMKAFHNCDMDFESYTCYSCKEYSKTSSTDDIITLDDTTEGSEYKWTGMCVDSIRRAHDSTPQSHDECTEQDDIGDFKPSIGTDGRYCACVIPFKPTSYEIDESILLQYQTEYVKAEEQNEIDYTSDNHRVELYNADFEFGTYRITVPGTYVIMEDITMDFNAGDDTDPQATGAWFPMEDQSNEYPGAGQLRDSYFLGFFAGITIECSDVILDLNGYTLKQSDSFYFQQRWFTIIELASQQFLPGQGPGFFGNDPKFGTDITIKNGVLGMSSHHGIHGNYNSNIKIEDIVVRQFETHGIQLNGFDNVELTNVDVGPTSTKAFLRGEYGHMRFILPRLRKIAEDNPDETMKFAARNEEWTAGELADEVEKQMNMAYSYVSTNIVPNCDNEDDKKSWESAQSVFINNNGIPFGSVQHGIFLNTEGTSVFNYNLETNTYSTNIKLTNVNIHGMQHQMDEWVRFSSGAEIFVTTFTSPIDGGAALGTQLNGNTMDDLKNMDNIEYQGNLVTDVWIAMGKLSDNWGLLGGLLVGNDRMIPWIEGNDVYANYALGCNVDAMLHSGKGILGLRIDGVSDLVIDGLEVYELKDLTPLGRSECGEYSDFDFNAGGGHFRQVKPMQDGFSGNMVQGVAINAVKDTILKNVIVHDLSSQTGAAFGIAVWPGNDITFEDDISVYNVYAGTMVSENTFSYDDRPNKAPEACGILEYKAYYDKENFNFYESNVNIDNTNIEVGCVTGHVGCRGSDALTHLGTYGTFEDCQPRKIGYLAPSDDSDTNVEKSMDKPIIWNPEFDKGGDFPEFNKGDEFPEFKPKADEPNKKFNLGETESKNTNTSWTSGSTMYGIYGIISLIILFGIWKLLKPFVSKCRKNKISYSLLDTEQVDNENYGSVAL